MSAPPRSPPASPEPTLDDAYRALALADARTRERDLLAEMAELGVEDGDPIYGLDADDDPGG